MIWWLFLPCAYFLFCVALMRFFRWANSCDEQTDKQNFKVTKIKGFARDVVNALNDEAEDGSCPVSRMLDAAIEHALDQGSENVDYDDETES